VHFDLEKVFEETSILYQIDKHTCEAYRLNGYLLLCKLYTCSPFFAVNLWYHLLDFQLRYPGITQGTGTCH